MKKNPAAVALGRIKSPAKSEASRANGKLGGRPKAKSPAKTRAAKLNANLPRWVSVKTKMPRNNQRVLAKYRGVYGPTVATYWFDGVNHHFGSPETLASEPATHWKEMESNAQRNARKPRKGKGS